MNSEELTTGCVKTPTSDDTKRRLARESLGYNCNNSKDFVRLFPDLHKLWTNEEKKILEKGTRLPATLNPESIILRDDLVSTTGVGVVSAASAGWHTRALALPASLESSLREIFTNHPDFPKPGINFVNVLPLWKHPSILRSLLPVLIEGIKTRFGEVDFFAGLEARGFLFAPLALAMGLPFCVLRKAGKLPGKVERIGYALEYGEAELEMEMDHGLWGKRGVILDDLLATGGTLRASKELLIKCGCTPIGALVLVELKELNGAEKAGLEIVAALAY